MAAITLVQAQAQLDAWMTANLELAEGKQVSMGGRSITRADCLEQIKFWQRQVNNLDPTKASAKVRRVTPID